MQTLVVKGDTTFSAWFWADTESHLDWAISWELFPTNDVNKMSSGSCVSYELCHNVCIFVCFHQARAIWCYCSDKVYLYQLMVKSVIFFTLMEWSALVNEMLLMMASDVESNPGPCEYLDHTITLTLTTCSTSSHMCDSELLWHCSQLHFTIWIHCYYPLTHYF